MDLMDKLAKLAQRYEELNTLMAQPEVLEDMRVAATLWSRTLGTGRGRAQIPGADHNGTAACRSA